MERLQLRRLEHVYESGGLWPWARVWHPRADFDDAFDNNSNATIEAQRIFQVWRVEASCARGQAHK